MCQADICVQTILQRSGKEHQAMIFSDSFWHSSIIYLNIRLQRVFSNTQNPVTRFITLRINRFENLWSFFVCGFDRPKKKKLNNLREKKMILSQWHVTLRRLIIYFFHIIRWRTKTLLNCVMCHSVFVHIDVPCACVRIWFLGKRCQQFDMHREKNRYNRNGKAIWAEGINQTSSVKVKISNGKYWPESDMDGIHSGGMSKFQWSQHTLLASLFVFSID